MTLDGTRTFLIGQDRPVVIDPGPQDETHLKAVERALAGASPRAILLTHGHSDHAGAAAALAERTGGPIWMGRGSMRLPFPTERVDRWLEGGEELACDSGRLKVHATPGHTREHLAFQWETDQGEGILFAGDLFLGVGDTTLVSHPEGSVADYLRSLDMVAALKPALVYPAHGPVLRRPEAAIRRFREHRLRRIEEVRTEARRQPGATADEMVDRVYGAALDPRLRGAARGSIEAILEYLKKQPGD
jgi:glyoxylase-like metal-dependent hydrolase (beta-lactamase superfamily II)